MFVRKSYAVDDFPPEIKGKVYLLKHFEKYIMDRLYGATDFTFQDVERQKGMEWVQQFLRTKDVIVFKLSHDVLQFNFFDHCKIVLSSHGLLISHLDQENNITRWPLADIIAQSLTPSAREDRDDVRFNRALLGKLNYIKEVLARIRQLTDSEIGNGAGITEVQVSASTLAEPPNQHARAPAAATRTLESRASRMALR